MGMTLAGCNPNFNDDSSVSPDVPGSSEDSSHSGGSSGGGGSTSEDTSSSEDTSESESESGSGSDSSESSSEEPTHTHTYSDTPTRFDSEPDYMQYIKGYDVYVCTHTDCDEEKKETVYYTKSEMLSLMNTFVASKSYIDPFEVREDLVSNNYPIIDKLTATEYFGFDLDTNKVALSSDTSVSHFLSFKEKSVSNLTELAAAFAEVESSTHSYSTIKLTSNLTTTQPILIDFANLFQLDLGGHTIDYTPQSGSAIRITNHITDKPDVVITNGTIQTKQMSGFNMDQTPKCVYFENGNSLRLSGVTLNNRAERGYAYADYPSSTGTAKVTIKKCTINSPVIGVCIQTNDNKVIENTINGSVVINGGDTLVSKNKINTSNITAVDVTHDTFIDNTEFAYVCEGYFVDEVASDTKYDTYMVTTVDAILIMDRRSTLGTYHLSSVTAEYNELTVRSTNAGAFGYGIRYIDFDFDPSQAENHRDDIHIGDDLTGDDNIYKSLSGSEAYNQPGGYIK